MATSTLCSPCTQTFPLSVHVVIYGLYEVGIREKIVIPCEKKKRKGIKWSKLVGTEMPFIIDDRNCRGSVRMSLLLLSTVA